MLPDSCRNNALRIWIDATGPACGLRIFGVPLLERQLRCLLEAGVEPAEVRIEAPSRPGDGTSRLPEDLERRLPLRWSRGDAPPALRLEQALREAPEEAWIAVEADAVADPRLLAHLAAHPEPVVFRSRDGAARSAVLRLEGGLPDVPSGARLAEIADAALAQGTHKEVGEDDFDGYIRKLRRHLPPYLLPVRDEASRDRAERFLFWSNYKGSTDVLTRYVYPPLVWHSVRPLARRRVHPNVLTLFNVAAALGAVPLFAAGWWVPGLALAYAMSVLDSVDGKLARLTFRSSRIGHLLDHGLDLVHPPFWYFGWAWALGGGTFTSPVFQASIAMAALYVADRIATRVFILRTGRSVHSYTPLDVRVRTFISRRNINLPVFTLGLAAGVPVPAFALIVAWQAATFAWHVERVVRYWSRRPPAAGA